MHFLAKNLKFLRKHGAKSPDEIAESMNKRKSTIVKWENGTSEPDLEELIALTKFFGISTDEILLTDLEKASKAKEPKPSESMNGLSEEIQEMKNAIEELRKHIKTSKK